MKFQGAVIKEQGVTFGIVIVKMTALNSTQERDSVAESFGQFFPGMPIILMAQDNRGIPKYYGRNDIVNFLANIDFSRIPWKEYTAN